MKLLPFLMVLLPTMYPSQQEHLAVQATSKKVEIVRFEATRTVLKKKQESKLFLGFKTDTAGTKLDWSLNCTGVVIKGWSSSQPLLITERKGDGIQTIEGRQFLGTNPAVEITIRRPKTLRASEQAECTASLQSAGSEQKKTVAFQIL